MFPLLRLFAIAVALTAASSFASEIKTVRDFGAVGDGKTDDTEAIQRAVGSGSLLFPKGIYRVTKSVVIDLDKAGFTAISGDGTARIVMAGAGAAFQFIGTHAGSADPKTIRPEVWERQRTPTVNRIEIVGEHQEADGIEVSGTMQLTVTATTVRGVRHAIHLTRRNRNVLISHCHIYENRGCGIFLDQVNLHQTNIIGCHISYNAGGGVVTRGGEVRNLHIGTCDIESNMTPNAAPAANVLIDCTNGSTDEVAITGCTLQHNSKSAGSANIRFIGRGITSLKDETATQEGHLVISGNVFSDVMVNIHLQHARGVSITGNTFWEGFEHDLLIEDSQCVVIGPNDFDRNPRYVVNGNWGKDRGGIVLRRCEDSKVQGLLLKSVWQQPAAMLLEQCTRCTVQDCSILDSDGLGLWLKDSKLCHVAGCVIRDDREEKKATLSFKQEGGKENWIQGNWLRDGAKGLDEADMRQNRL
ncbi:right-handed parallel beta-helix repeat-containing protein [Verrucomicrobiota bacterium sgz303538]